MRTLLHKHRRRILVMTSVIAAAAYIGTTLGDLREPSRLSAFLLAGALTADIADTHYLERTGGTCMVILLSIFLMLEGVSRSKIQGMSELSFLEMTLGLYLVVASWLLVRRRGRF